MSCTERADPASPVHEASFEAQRLRVEGFEIGLLHLGAGIWIHDADVLLGRRQH